LRSKIKGFFLLFFSVLIKPLIVPVMNRFAKWYIEREQKRMMKQMQQMDQE